MLASAPNMRLAIVIPTLNEERALASRLPEVMTMADEVWISDGGSEDTTVEIAEKLGARVTTGPPGRGRQLQRGALASRADILLFLHADSRLPVGATEQVRRAVREGAIGGGFHVCYGQEGRLLRWGDRLIHLRTRFTRCPLGDQGQFVTRAAFELLGGFREWPILEDLDFIRRLKRQGRIVIFDGPVITSPRRVLRQGIVRSVATNWLIWALYFFGVSPHLLARLYLNIR